jgi:Ser/Thr protein kinase RdoA (MazF antagonist)
MLKPALAEMGLQEEYEYLAAKGRQIANHLGSLDSSQFSYGYCQYDFMPKNFHFDALNNITFFDFDFAGEGWLANDLMSYWVHFALNTTLGRSTQEHSEKEFGIFLAAYQEIRPLSEEEIKAIPYLNFGFWIFYMAFHYEHFDDFSSQFWGPRWLKDRIGLIRKLIELHAP